MLAANVKTNKKSQKKGESLNQPQLRSITTLDTQNFGQGGEFGQAHIFARAIAQGVVQNTEQNERLARMKLTFCIPSLFLNALPFAVLIADTRSCPGLGGSGLPGGGGGRNPFGG